MTTQDFQFVKSRWPIVLLVLVVALVAWLAYAGGVWIGLRMDGGSWPYWPGNGFTAAVIILRPKREWFLYALASALGELSYGSDWSEVAILIAMGNAFECLVCAYLFCYLTDGRTRLDNPRTVTHFIVAAIIATMSSTATAVFVLLTARDALPNDWFALYYLIGNLLGLLVVTPAFLALPTYLRWFKLKRHGLMFLFWIFLAGEVFLSFYVFGVIPPAAFATPLPYLVVPIAVAHTLVYGYAGACAAVAAIAFVGVAVTPNGAGPFATTASSITQHIASLQIFMAALAVSLLFLGAYVTSRVHLQRRTAKLESDLIRASSRAAIMPVASLVGHDVKNMLQIVSGYAETGRRMPEELLRQIHRINQLLTSFVRISAGEDRQKVFVVDDCMMELDQLFDRLCADLIRLDYQLGAPNTTVLGDPLQFELCLFNLVQNAIDAMPDGGVLIVETRIADQVVQVDICDTGEGLDNRIIEHLFEPFQTTKESGTGFGLYASKKAVETMQGSLCLESTDTSGTTFRIELPIYT